MRKNKYCVELDGVDCSFPDRYMGCGYGKSYTIPEMFERVATVDKITGIELVSNWQITPENAQEMKKYCEDYNLDVVAILPDHFGVPKWGKGAFTSTDPAIRADAIQTTKTYMDIAAEIGCKQLTIWNGQDGYDYPFTANYLNEMTWLQEGIKECADYRTDINLAVEYKFREPRLHCYLANVYATLAFLQAIDRKNVGVCLDVGHAFIAHENPAEAVAACKLYGDKLFHVHMNDNFNVWDDDCITATEHVIETMEFMYWLKKTGYDGWFSFDQYTPRLDGRDALVEGINWVEDITAAVDSIDDAKMEEMFKNVNAVEMSKMVRELLFHR